MYAEDYADADTAIRFNRTTSLPHRKPKPKTIYSHVTYEFQKEES